MKKFLFRFMIGAFFALNSMCADCPDSIYATVSDLESQLVEVDNGVFMIDVDNYLHPLSAFYTDENGFCYLKISKKHKKYNSTDTSENDEMACLLGCPDCGRVQTCSLVVKNKGRCSRCRLIFPASAYSWKCTNCGTQNYLNPERCGVPWCRCLRELCDPDMKTNLNS